MEKMDRISSLGSSLQKEEMQLLQPRRRDINRSMKFLFAAVVLSLVTTFAASGKTEEGVPKNWIVVIKTTRGDARVQLFPSVAPLAASAFLLLAGDAHYDGATIKDVVHDHHIRFDANGLADWTMRLDFNSTKEAGLRHTERGLLCYPKQNLQTNRAAVFVMLQAHPWFSDQYIAFGKVISGMSALEALQVNDSVLKIEIENREAALAFAWQTLDSDAANHPGFHAP